MVFCCIGDVDIKCTQERADIGSDEIGERLVFTSPKAVQMPGKSVCDIAGEFPEEALA